jgi:hypothetical protein
VLRCRLRALSGEQPRLAERIRYGGVMSRSSRCGLFSPTALTLAALAFVSLVSLPPRPAVAAVDAATSLSIVTVGHTGSHEWWTLPSAVTSIGVDAEGAQGAGTLGGLGGWTHAVIPLTPSGVVYVFVGVREMVPRTDGTAARRRMLVESAARGTNSATATPLDPPRPPRSAD